MATKLFPILCCSDLRRSMEFYGGLLGGVGNYRFPDNRERAFIALTIGDSVDGCRQAALGRCGFLARPGTIG